MVHALTGEYDRVILSDMKVAISIPEHVFRAAERMSKRKRISRSQLYSRALEAYIKAESEEQVTEQLDRVYARASSELEPMLEAASLEVLRRERWE
jgi:metal-responsive CopG/Arc/MetJ family transcriptional regulator